ncbi:YfhO family protein, partial [Faecalicatena contorta]|uniref:YfhO family protein n=1 Tax=Faecalicatena contorta TaxID=39482 RepID=UPI001F2CD531
NLALKFLLCLDMIMDPFFHTGLSISDSLKTVRKSVLIYETIIKETTLEDQRNELVQSEFQMDKEETKGNVIKGIVEGDKDGYLITSIPYDENFEILIDGKETEYEKVNTAFLGMKVQEGKHEIEMIYHAPGVMIGKILSMIGVVVLFSLNVVMKRRRYERYII